MLDLAREKAARPGRRRVRFEWADALQLPYDEGRFDAVTVGFGVRNFADLRSAACARWRASCRPGGRLVILEFTQPARPPFSTFYSLWFDRHRAGARASLPDNSGGLRLPARVGAQLSRPARPGREDGRRRLAAHPLDRPRRAASSPSTAASQGSSDPPLRRAAAGHGGARRLQSLAAGAARTGGGDAARAGRRPRRGAGRRRGDDARGRRQAPAADAGAALRGRRRRRGGGAGGEPRSS